MSECIFLDSTKFTITKPEIGETVTLIISKSNCFIGTPIPPKLPGCDSVEIKYNFFIYITISTNFFLGSKIMFWLQLFHLLSVLRLQT